MAKKKRNNQRVQKEESKEVSLGEHLGNDILQQLKEKKKVLEAKEVEKQEVETARKKEEARQREKNKSFEELLGESNLSWKDYK